MVEVSGERPTPEEVMRALDAAIHSGSIAIQMEDPVRSGSARENALMAKIRLGEIIANAGSDVLRQVLAHGKSETGRNPS